MSLRTGARRKTYCDMCLCHVICIRDMIHIAHMDIGMWYGCSVWLSETPREVCCRSVEGRAPCAPAPGVFASAHVLAQGARGATAVASRVLRACAVRLLPP